MTLALLNKIAVTIALGVGAWIVYWKNHPARRHLERWAWEEGYFLDESRMVGGNRAHTTFRITVRPRPNAFGVPWIPPPERNAEDQRWLAPRRGRARVYTDGRVEVDLTP